MPDIASNIVNLVEEAERALQPVMRGADEICEHNQFKVLRAMQDVRLAESDFSGTTGYGYNDRAREALEAVYCKTFNTEAALVRPQLVSGTHALTAAFFGNLRPGDTVLSPTGLPYDTLHSVIGINPARGSLAEYGIKYLQADLQDGEPDYERIRALIAADPTIKLAAIQRSKGYSWRKSFSVKELGALIAFIKSVNPSIICMVDNCYGEFVEKLEPTDAGADLAVGSLIKNPGGGLAPVGGYIVGKSAYVEAAAHRLTAPGLGSEVGPTLGAVPLLMQGFFIAPQTVQGCVKGAILAAQVFKNLGYPVLPEPSAPRSDIVQAIRLGTAEKVLAFCKGIQSAAPVDSFVTPEPGDMPGYKHQVIMAAGAFVQGSSIELSADAPLKEPYNVYFQGGLTYAHAKIGVMCAVKNITKNIIGRTP